MKFNLLTFLIAFAWNVPVQKLVDSAKASDHSTYVKGSDFEGVIFSEKYTKGYFLTGDQGEKFTPSTNDILEAEMLIKDDKAVVKDAFIHKNLKRYLRQYAGHLIQNGQKIIFVNLFWKAQILDQEKLHRELPNVPVARWKEYWYQTSDGGHYYWRIKVNLSKKELFEFSENGLG